MQGSSEIKWEILICVICRQLRGKVDKQLMADLPRDPLWEGPPSTHCSVEIFGSFLIKEKKNILNLYGALFTSLASCAIHIEMILYS